MRLQTVTNNEQDSDYKKLVSEIMILITRINKKINKSRVENSLMNSIKDEKTKIKLLRILY